MINLVVFKINFLTKTFEKFFQSDIFQEYYLLDNQTLHGKVIHLVPYVVIEILQIFTLLSQNTQSRNFLMKEAPQNYQISFDTLIEFLNFLSLQKLTLSTPNMFL